MTHVIVIGDGIIGLCVARALALRDVSCAIVGERLPGAATSASAGLLAPSVGRVRPDVRALLMAGRDRYPAFIESLSRDTGMAAALDASGIIEIADRPDELEEILGLAPASRMIPRRELASLEPALRPALAVLHPDDGFVAVPELVRALDAFVDRDARIRRIRSRVTAISADRVTCSDSTVHEADALVLAAGAWAPFIAGLPRQLAISPLKGQMLVVDGIATRRAVMAPECYVVTRGAKTLVGSSAERVGFDADVTGRVQDTLREGLSRLVPSFANAASVDGWAGLRPATPDMLPYIGRDPGFPSLFYACGHSKNGVLLGPITGDWIASMICSERLGHELSAFAVDREQRGAMSR